VLDFLWNLLILGFACVFTWYGYQAARNISGEYWELGMLSRSYPMMILPVAGVLISPPVSRCSAKTFVS
jgi:TRAP-type C4-dicarboxylate transport system permease small subunit